ncbi:MAG: hypothetical protein EVA43_05960 [Flavobacteriales bacterium]|nr:MAG: hypothetical protein EVA43_05960 [Flavobacteriales bacterium]
MFRYKEAEKKTLLKKIKERRELNEIIRNRTNYRFTDFSDFIIKKAAGTIYNYDQYFFKYSIYHLNEFVKPTHHNNTLLMEAPPRTGKTETVINLLLYLLATQNNKRFIVVAGDKSKLIEISIKIKSFATSEFCKKYFGDLLNKSQKNTESLKEFANGNSIIFKTTGSNAPTGKGYHYIFLIDYFTQTHYNSRSKREYALANANGFLTRDEKSPRTKVIIDNQRLGLNDFTDYIITNSKNTNIGFDYIKFPYQFTDEWSSEEKRTYFINNEKYIYNESSYLINVFDDYDKNLIQSRVGKRIFLIQYQGIVKNDYGEVLTEEYFKSYSKEELENEHFTNLIITIDTATKTKEANDFSSIGLYGKTEYKGIYLIDMETYKVSPYEFEERLHTFIAKWKDGLKTNLGRVKIKKILIENASSGLVLLENLKNKSSESSRRFYNILKDYNLTIEGINAQRLESQGKGKYGRLYPHISKLAEEKIKIPLEEVGYMRYAETLNFKSECLEFTTDDKHLHDDRLDTMLIALHIFSKTGFNMSYNVY